MQEKVRFIFNRYHIGLKTFLREKEEIKAWLNNWLNKIGRDWK